MYIYIYSKTEKMNTIRMRSNLTVGSILHALYKTKLIKLHSGPFGLVVFWVKLSKYISIQLSVYLPLLHPQFLSLSLSLYIYIYIYIYIYRSLLATEC